MRGNAIEQAARIGGAVHDPVVEACVDGLLGDIFGEPIATCAQVLGLERPRQRAPLVLRVSGDRIADEERAEAELAQATDAAARPAPQFSLRIVPRE